MPGFAAIPEISIYANYLANRVLEYCQARESQYRKVDMMTADLEQCCPPVLQRLIISRKFDNALDLESRVSERFGVQLPFLGCRLSFEFIRMD